MNPYTWNSEAYKESRCTPSHIRIQAFLPLIGKSKEILDVACLDGTIGTLLKAQGNNVTGIDASEPAIKKAIERGINAKLGNLEEPMPFDDNSFDLVFAGEIIEHIFDIDMLFSEMYRVLKPSGELIVTTPNLAAFGRRLLLLTNHNPHVEISFTGNAAGHIRYFIKSTLFDLLRKHSFKPCVFTSDVVNFNATGTMRNRTLAKLFPTIGSSLIVKATKK